MIYYDGRFKITFVKVNDDGVSVRDSWKNFRLVPTEKPILDPPKPYIEYVKVPMSNNYLDLSTALSDNKIIYEPFEGTFKFYVDHERLRMTSLQAYNYLSSYFDGSYILIFLREVYEYDKIVLDLLYNHGQYNTPFFMENRLPDYGGSIIVDSYDYSDGYSTIGLKYKLYHDPISTPSIMSLTTIKYEEDPYPIPRPKQDDD